MFIVKTRTYRSRFCRKSPPPQGLVLGRRAGAVFCRMGSQHSTPTGRLVSAPLKQTSKNTETSALETVWW